MKAEKGMVESNHKLDILRLALEKRITELTPDHIDKMQQIRDELASGKSLVSIGLEPCS